MDATLVYAAELAGQTIDALVEAEWWGPPGNELRGISRVFELGERKLLAHLALIKRQAEERIHADVLLDAGTTTETDVTAAE